jgi:hypothetical protein
VTRIATPSAIRFTAQIFDYPRNFRPAVTKLPKQYTGMNAP